MTYLGQIFRTKRNPKCQFESQHVINNEIKNINKVETRAGPEYFLNELFYFMTKWEYNRTRLPQMKERSPPALVETFSYSVDRSSRSLILNCLFTESQCVTPNRSSGNCIPIEQCPRLYELWRSRPSSNDREFLRQSQCGSQRYTTYVSLSFDFYNPT